MSIILDLLYMLYTLLAIVLVIALIAFTPRLMQKLLPNLEHEKQLLLAISVHMLIIIFLVVNAWRFEVWKDNYDDARSGVFVVNDDYQPFLDRHYPELAATNKVLVRAMQSRDQYVIEARTLSLKLGAHQPFLKRMSEMWINQIEPLKNSHRTINRFAAQAQIAHRTELSDRNLQYMQNVSFDLARTAQQRLQKTKQSDQTIAAALLNHAKFGTQLLNGHPKATIRRDIQYSAENYQALLRYLDEQYPSLKKGMKTSYKSVVKANRELNKLKNTKPNDPDIAQLVFEMRNGWHQARGRIQSKMIIALYAVEIDMVSRRLGIPASHPVMQQLQQSLQNRMPQLYASIKQNESRLADSYSTGSYYAAIGQ